MFSKFSVFLASNYFDPRYVDEDDSLRASSSGFQEWMLIVILAVSVIIMIVAILSRRNWSSLGFLIFCGIIMFITMMQVVVIYAEFSKNILAPMVVMSGFFLFHALKKGGENSRKQQKSKIPPDGIAGPIILVDPATLIDPMSLKCEKCGAKLYVERPNKGAVASCPHCGDGLIFHPKWGQFPHFVSPRGDFWD